MGEVGCIPTTASISLILLLIYFKACIHADSDVEREPDIVLGLVTVFAPYFFESDKIFLESELTQTLCIFFDFKQDLIDQYMSGRPLILIIFLFLIPFEPPLAKIIAIVCSLFFLNKVFTNI